MNSSKNIKKSIKQLILPGTKGTDKQIINDALAAFELVLEDKSNKVKLNILRMVMRNPITKIAVAASFLVVVSFIISFVLYGKVVDLRNELDLARQDSITTPIDDSVTINFYIKEHQDFIAQQASLNSAASLPIRLQINQDDLMYYEFLDNQSELMNPGIIIRGTSSQQEIGSSEAPAISNGHALIFSEAQEATDFDIVSPSWFHPYYKLGQIRIIEGRDALQLLYTNGINSISLFEQPLDGQNGLSHQDFREYAVYNNQGEGRGTILAWRGDTLSYVLIGNVEISQLMDMAQSINAVK